MNAAELWAFTAAQSRVADPEPEPYAPPPPRPDGKCSVVGCDGNARARDGASKGLCAKHSRQYRRTGDPYSKREPIAGATCCGKPAVARWKGEGDPLCARCYYLRYNA